MELRHLKYFLKLAEERSFVRAADKLFISQPPLSRQIKELETELCARLFERNNKRVILTEAGKYYQKEVQELLQNLERINATTKKISKNKSGEFRIAYVSSTFSGDISKLIQYLSNEYPYVNFRLYEVPTVKQIAALEEGKIDFGIIRAPLHSPKIDSQLWFKDRFSLVFNKNHYPITSDKDFENLQTATFVFFNKDYAPHFHDALLEICSQYGFKPKVVHESNNISSIIQLVKNGLGISIVPSAIQKTHNYPELKYINLQKAQRYTDILLATPKGNPSEIAQKAITFLTQKKSKNEQ
ncbi:LysR family transcriptional regulator [Flavobacterium sp. MAHUQ-51]|uniref:LysR family transcriptional regulator n=1 Tax=Flavobacterium sp. GCM10022190 TaxID=3252639 RepID=UPI00360D3915